MNFFKNDGINIFIMQSKQNLEIVIPIVQELIENGYSVYGAIEIALKYYNLEESDFTDTDWKYLFDFFE